MALLVSLLLPFMACVLVVLVTSALWWRSLRSPLGFATFALLSMLGLHRLLQVAAELIKLFTPGGYFLEHRQSPDFTRLAEQSMTIEAVLMTVVLALVGWPLMRWLRALLSRQGGSAG